MVILIGVLALITALLFFRCKQQRISYFSGSNTVFDLNEMSWIPTEIKTLLKNRINDDVVPAVRNLMQRSWANVSQAEKDEILTKGNEFFTKLVAEIDKASLSVTVAGSP
jgi:hypothetical protein